MDYLILIWIHFIADFIMQNDKMALNKRSSLKWLSIHCFIYSIPFLIFGISFAIITGIFHFIVDIFSSKVTSYLWQKEERHWFFVVIGLDQAIHMTCLILLLKYL